MFGYIVYSFLKCLAIFYIRSCNVWLYCIFVPVMFGYIVYSFLKCLAILYIRSCNVWLYCIFVPVMFGYIVYSPSEHVESLLNIGSVKNQTFSFCCFFVN